MPTQSTPPVFFSGEGSFLSNFHPSRIFIEEKEYDMIRLALPFVPHRPGTRLPLIFYTAEALYQALKFPVPDWAGFTGPMHPVEAKRKGKTKQSPIALTPDIRKRMMLLTLRLKFDLRYLKLMLQETGDAPLVHTPPHGDLFWGAVIRYNALDVEEWTTWEGENWQGRLLEHVRAEINMGVL